MDTGTLRLITFSFILSILFPTFSYVFTNFGVAPENYDVSLDADTLINAGIQLQDGLSHNVTYGGSAVEYTVGNQTMRIQWKEPPGPLGAYFSHTKKGWLQNILDTWWNAIEMGVIADISDGVRGPTYITNQTVILHWDSTYNWTKYQINDNSLWVFITPYVSDGNNITHSIYERGNVTVTVGSVLMNTSDDMGAMQFLQWYRTVVFNGGSQWGLPSFMTWVIRIFSFMMVLSGILLAKELREFLPI